MSSEGLSAAHQFGRRIVMGMAFVLFSAVFGPFLLYDPPMYGGYDRRQALAIVIGLTAWASVFWLVAGLPWGDLWP